MSWLENWIILPAAKNTRF